MTKKKRFVGLSDKVRHAKKKTSFPNKKKLIETNPFEVKINKQKHNIIGRKLKHDRGLPGISRSKSLKKRKDTLLQEYKQMNKANKIKDERLGAYDQQLSLEEKMLQRFALERKRKHEKMSRFNLNDEEELTHLGQSLSMVNDYVDESDDDQNEQNFGGGILQKSKPNENETKSKREVIDEIIAKAKSSKHEKQVEKDKSDELCQKLDESWKDFHQFLTSSMRSKKDKEREKPDDFEMLLKEMMFERRVVPGERKKTKEELRREEEAKRNKQEEEKLSRMKATLNMKKTKHESADALGEEFASDKNDSKAPMLVYPFLEDMPSGEEDVNSEEFNDTESLDDMEKESEIADQGIVDDGASLDDDELDESDDFSDIDSGNEDDTDIISLEEDQNVVEADETDEIKPAVNPTSNFPSSYAEFIGLMSSSCTAAELTERLRREYAPDLAKGNKAKLIELFAYVWEHSCRMASLSPPNMAVVGSLCSHLYELCCVNTESCVQCVIERLKRSYHFCFLSKNANRPKWPKFEMLVQFKLIKLFFSTSDYSHSVATRSILFICNVLNSCRVSSMRELACGLFLVSLAYEYVCFSKRFLPECVSFLATCLAMSIPSDKQRKSCLPPIVDLHLDKTNSNLLVVNCDLPDDNPLKLELSHVFDDPIGQDASNETRSSFLLTTLRLTEMFVELYSSLPAFDQALAPVSTICDLMREHYGDFAKLSRRLDIVRDSIDRNCKKPRVRLTVGPVRPKSLKLYSVKFEPTGEPFEKRSRNVSAAKRYKDRLLHKRRREMKGAVREIRKDAKFLAVQKQKEMEELDAERKAKVKRLYGFLSNQEGDVKKIQRSKYKLEV